MASQNNNIKKYRRYIPNILLISFLVIFVTNPGLKGFFLRQLLNIGFYKVNIPKAATNKNSEGTLSFAFTDFQNRTSNLSALKGKVLVINFWATWCPPCRAEMPSLNNLYAKLKDDRRIVFLFINEDEDNTKALQFLSEKYPSIPFYTSSGEVPVQIFSGTLPTTLVINKEGKIALKHDGMGNYDTEEFMKELEGLL